MLQSCHFDVFAVTQFYLNNDISRMKKSYLMATVSQDGIEQTGRVVAVWFITRPRPKAGGRVLNPARFVCLFVCLFVFFGVANQHS